MCVKSNKQQKIVINDENDVLTSKVITQANLTVKALQPFLFLNKEILNYIILLLLE